MQVSFTYQRFVKENLCSKKALLLLISIYATTLTSGTKTT